MTTPTPPAAGLAEVIAEMRGLCDTSDASFAGGITTKFARAWASRLDALAAGMGEGAPVCEVGSGWNGEEINWYGDELPAGTKLYASPTPKPAGLSGQIDYIRAQEMAIEYEFDYNRFCLALHRLTGATP